MPRLWLQSKLSRLNSVKQQQSSAARSAALLGPVQRALPHNGAQLPHRLTREAGHVCRPGAGCQGAGRRDRGQCAGGAAPGMSRKH